MTLQQHNGIQEFKKSKSQEMPPLLVAGCDTTLLMPLQMLDTSVPKFQETMKLADAQAVASGTTASSSWAGSSTEIVPLNKRADNLLVVQHNQQQWCDLMSRNMYDDELQELMHTSIVTEFVLLYWTNQLHALKRKLTQWLVAKKFPDVTTDITIKVANANFPLHAKDLDPMFKGGYARFTNGQHMLCMQVPQNLRQTWPEDFARPDGPTITAWYDGQQCQWPNSFKNSMVIAFTIGSEGVCLPNNCHASIPQ